MPAEAAQLEMADLNDWFGNFNGESIGHEQGPADVLAEEFQPAEDVDVAPNGGEGEGGCSGQLHGRGNAGGGRGIDGKNLVGPLPWGVVVGQRSAVPEIGAAGSPRGQRPPTPDKN